MLPELPPTPAELPKHTELAALLEEKILAPRLAKLDGQSGLSFQERSAQYSLTSQIGDAIEPLLAGCSYSAEDIFGHMAVSVGTDIDDQWEQIKAGNVIRLSMIVKIVETHCKRAIAKIAKSLGDDSIDARPKFPARTQARIHNALAGVHGDPDGDVAAHFLMNGGIPREIRELHRIIGITDRVKFAEIFASFFQTATLESEGELHDLTGTGKPDSMVSLSPAKYETSTVTVQSMQQFLRELQTQGAIGDMIALETELEREFEESRANIAELFGPAIEAYRLNAGTSRKNQALYESVLLARQSAFRGLEGSKMESQFDTRNFRKYLGRAVAHFQETGYVPTPEFILEQLNAAFQIPANQVGHE